MALSSTPSTRLMLLASCVALASMMAAVCGQSDPSFDHQTTSYSSQFQPVQQTREMSATPFFSPDHSIGTITNLIERAEETLDIGTPGFSSWSGCTDFDGSGDDDASQCVGCSIYAMRQEQFPVFPAIVNALHRGVTVRLLTNNYNTPTCSGKIAPLDFLKLNGAQVRYYDTTTFWHAKYLSADNKNTSVSSVNFSYTSFMENREAGLVLGEGAEPFVSFMASVFESDWEQATEYTVQQSYSSNDMYEITKTSAMPVDIPAPRSYPGAYVTPFPEAVVGYMDSTLYASPDYARSVLMKDIEAATSSFDLMMYQVTDEGLCKALMGMQSSGVELTVLVSAVIYDATDSQLAAQCYKQLTSAGITVYTTPSFYKYSHQKFWIMDGKSVGMSTGNWSPTDYPSHSYFPPYGSQGWANANRDFTIHIVNERVVDVFANVMQQDLNRGSTWSQ